MDPIPPSDGPRILRHLYRVTRAEVARELAVSVSRVTQLERSAPGSAGNQRVVAAILAAAAKRTRE